MSRPSVALEVIRSFFTSGSMPSFSKCWQRCLQADHLEMIRACPARQSRRHSKVPHPESYGRRASFRILAGATALAWSPFLRPLAPSSEIWPIGRPSGCLPTWATAAATAAATDFIAIGHLELPASRQAIANLASNVHRRPNTEYFG